MRTVPARALALAGSASGRADTRLGPVALVGWIRVVAVIVAGSLCVGDEVVAGQELPLHVRMVGQDAGVDDGDRDALAGGLRPCVGGVDAVGARGHIPLLGEVGIVGDVAVLGGAVVQGGHVHVGLDCLDAVGGLECGDEVLDLVHGELVTQLDGCRAHGVSGNGLQLDRELSGGGGQCLPVLGGQGVEDVLAVGLRGGDDLGRPRALGVGDDEAVAGLGGVRGSAAAFKGRCRRRCGGAAAAEDSGTNQADGDDGDHRDGGGNDDQDAFSAEGHSHVERLSVGTPRGLGVVGSPECDESGMERRHRPIGDCG